MSKFCKPALIGFLSLAFVGTGVQAQPYPDPRSYANRSHLEHEPGSPWYNPYAYTWQQYNLRDR